MNVQDDTDFVIRELGKYRSHDDIVLALCERSGYEWNEASDFVHRIELEQAEGIQAERRPLLTILGLAFILSGLALTILSVYSLLIGELVPLTIEIFFVEHTFPNGGQLAGLMIGLAIMLGGITGVWKASQK